MTQLDSMLEDLKGSLRGVASARQAVDTASSILIRYTRDPLSLPERLTRPAGECYARHLVYRDPEDGFTVVAMVWGPGQRTPVHDHAGTWCVEGCVVGRLEITNYQLLEELGGDRVRMTPRETVEVGKGAVGRLIPPLEHHAISNPFPDPAVTLHVYGDELRVCTRFLPLGGELYRVEKVKMAYTSAPAEGGAPDGIVRTREQLPAILGEPSDVADRIVARLRSFTDAERQRHTVNYYPSAQENLGVYAADLRRVVSEYRRPLREEPAGKVVELCLALIRRNTLEGRQVAYELLASHPEASRALDAQLLEALGKGMDNWASVDGFGTGLAGPAWRAGRLPDERVERWSASEDPWWRRAALVSTVALNLKSRGGRGDAPRTLGVCERLVDDPHPMVQKALSWALRALIPWDALAVKSFLERHGTRVPALVRREVRRKLETGRKTPPKHRHLQE
ncbi:MAG: DNA alkylation repair protein [Armatimonadetes bacterium]|nr:DNA alkylation repair protein [Armatimonadota bacterium]